MEQEEQISQNKTNNYSSWNKKKEKPREQSKIGTIFLEQEEQIFQRKKNIREQKNITRNKKK
jgi:hypothetical protein